MAWQVPEVRDVTSMEPDDAALVQQRALWHFSAWVGCLTILLSGLVISAYIGLYTFGDSVSGKVLEAKTELKALKVGHSASYSLTLQYPGPDGLSITASVAVPYSDFRRIQTGSSLSVHYFEHWPELIQLSDSDGAWITSFSLWLPVALIAISCMAMMPIKMRLDAMLLARPREP